MIHWIMSWLRKFGRKQPEEVLTNTTVSTSRKRGRPKLSESQKTNAKKKSK